MSRDTAMLTPIFENIPQELKKLNRWVVWKDDKIPYDPHCTNSKAATNRPNSWGTFEQAHVAFEEGGWLGMGFVLNGDGIVGVDLDDCVLDGKPSPEALAILEELEAGYIEISPSGSGLHAFGYGENLKKGVNRVYNNVNVELYSSKRYLTLTGHTIQGGNLKSLNGFAALAEKISGQLTQETQETQETKSNACVSYGSYGSYVSPASFPAKTVPSGTGQRNKAIFQLARWLKGVGPGCSQDRQRQIVQQWHAMHLNVIGTKDIGETWVDFCNAWSKVKLPYGATLNLCISDLPPAPVIPKLELCGGKGKHLMQICIAFQRRSGDQPFFLAARKAGELIGCDHNTAANFLRYFLQEGWLTLEIPNTLRLATSYKVSSMILAAPEYKGDSTV